MRIFEEQQMESRDVLAGIKCNQCGKELTVCNGILKEGCAGMEISFDYFSKKDGELHRIDLCEHCYDIWTSGFCIPVTVEDMNELI